MSESTSSLPKVICMHVNLHTIFHLLGHNDFLRFEEKKKTGKSNFSSTDKSIKKKEIQSLSLFIFTSVKCQIPWQSSGQDSTLSLLRAQFNPCSGNQDAASHTMWPISK